MIELEEEICCTKTKVIVGRSTLNVLRDNIKGKVLVVRQKHIPRDKIANILVDGVFEYVLEGGEQDKDIEVVFKIVELLYEARFQRSDYVVAIGGGTLTDVVGFASSIYMRGARLVLVPTTFLCMVDAAIGGKNAVNFRGVKNVIGTFYQPSLVLVDLSFLDTLPQQELVNGLAEVIKYGVTLDRELLEYLKANYNKVLDRDEEALEYIIYRSILNKISVVKEDPYETKDIRIVLNFGHTVGHAIEASTDFKVPHGRAVAMGMVLEAMFGEIIGVTPRYCVTSIIDVLRYYGLPTSIDELGVSIDKEVFISSLIRDKKARGSNIVMPLPIDVGSWKRYSVPIDLVSEVVAKWIG